MWKNRVKNKLKIKYLPYFAIGKSATARKAPAESFLETRTYTHIHTRVPSCLNQAENKNNFSSRQTSLQSTLKLSEFERTIK